MPNIENKYIVFVVLGIYPCSTGGMEIFYHNLLPEIAKHENVLLITKCKQMKNASFAVIQNPDRIFSIPGTGRLASLIFTAVNLFRIRKIIKIVHLPYTSNAGQWGLVFPLLKKLFGIRYLLHIHGGGMRKWKRFGADKILFHYASKILAVSDAIKKEYAARSGRNIQIVLPLVSSEMAPESKLVIRRRLRIGSQDRVILFVGSLKGLKAPDVVLEAFIRVGKNFIAEHRIKLIFIGSGHLQDILLARVKALDLGKHVLFTGLVPYDQIPLYYKLADIYVISSHYEGTPKSLLEAMFNQLPIIGTDVNGINDILVHNENALLFAKNNIEQLKDHIMTLIIDTEKAVALSKAAFKKYNDLHAAGNTVNQLIQASNEIIEI